MLPQTLRDVTSAKSVTDKATATPGPGAVPLADANATLNKWATEAGMPLWDSRYAIQIGGGYNFTVPKHGFIWVMTTVGSSGAYCIVTINGINVFYANSWGDIYRATSVIPVRKGDVAYVSNDSAESYLWFFPSFGAV